MANGQPEQWAVELLAKTRRIFEIAETAKCGADYAALTIQRDFTERTAELVADNAKLRESADSAWKEARELVIGTNADLCKGGDNQTYRLIIEDLTNAINNPELRTFAGRVEARRARQALAQQDKPDAK